MIHDEKVSQFWHWFSDNSGRIIAAVGARDEDWLRREFNLRVLHLVVNPVKPRLNWEIGPGIIKQWQFSLSPMVRSNLDATREIISRAPSLPKWEFYAAKPPRRSQTLEYQLIEPGGILHSFDASEWQYILRSLGNQLFSIELIGDIDAGIDQDFLRKAAYLAVEGVIGEEMVIEHISDISYSPIRDAKDTTPRTKLALLEKHLKHLMNKS